MKRAADELGGMMDGFRDALRRSGVKITPQRLAVYRETARSCDHPDIEAIFRNVRKKIPSVSLDTVYRALDVFRELGLVSALRPLDARTRFDADVKRHHHFVCVGCGLMRDIHDPGLDGVEIPESAKALGRVDSTHVAFKGLCGKCLKERKIRNPKGG